MEVKQILHMNKGEDETSYAKNSKIQCKILSITKPIIEEIVLKILRSDLMPKSFGIADLGCSSGPNSLLLVSEVMEVIQAEYSRLNPPSLQLQSSTTEFRVFLNDLFSNDFNTIFLSLPEFYDKFKQKFKDTSSTSEGPNLFISAVPGSFYGRLFPTKSLHFVHSSSSLHWLSQVPPGLVTALNKGKIYISKSSPECVMEAYSQQFQKDFSLFLKSRAAEIVLGGRMVLSFMGRRYSDPTIEESCYLQWELLAQALMSLVSELVCKSVEEYKAYHCKPSVKKKRVFKKWESPPRGRLKINIDGAFNLELGKGGVGVIARNEEGVGVAAAAKPYGNALSALVMEAEACRTALLLGKNQGWTNIIIECDSILLVTALTREGVDLSEVGQILGDCKALIHAFQSFEIRHIFREANGVADRLAHLASVSALEGVWLEEMPAIIQDVLYEDSSYESIVPRGFGFMSPPQQISVNATHGT